MAIFPMKRNDTAPSIQLTLTRGGEPVNLTDASGVTFILRAPGAAERKVEGAATIVTAAGGVVQYDWATGDTDTVGEYNVECKIAWSNNTIESVPNIEEYDQVVITAGL